MTIDINRREIAIRYANERRSNRLASCNKYGFGLVYTNQQIRDRVLGDLFAPYAWPGGYPVVFYVTDAHNGCTGDVLCADCARTAVIDNRESVAADIYYKGPIEYCAGCNREIESAYGDPDAEEEEEEEEEERCTCYGINIHDSTCPLWEDPRTADDYAGMHVFNG
jgi:hypothetical protein